MNPDPEITVPAREAATTRATWYFDFISPFAYLQFARFDELPVNLDVTLRPVVFAALLNHWGHKGPAEIPSKRRFVYRFFQWQAARRGVPFTMPPVHPFDPLPALRLALVAGTDRGTIARIFRFIYGEGRNLESEPAISDLAARLGIADPHVRLSDQGVKAALKANTDAAIADGVFGVPTFVVDGELFWGDDATDMLLDYLRDRSLFAGGEMRRISEMPMGRRRGRS